MVNVGPLSPPGTIDLNAGASLGGAPQAMVAAWLAVAFGGCPHANAVPVETVDGDRVAVLCPDCDVQLPAEWETRGHD